MEDGSAPVYQLGPWVQRPAALPFLPVSMVPATWIEIMEDVSAIRQTQEFHDYTTNTSIDGHAQLPLGTWHHLEGWHSPMNKVVQRAHPNKICSCHSASGIGKDSEKQVDPYDPWCLSPTP